MCKALAKKDDLLMQLEGQLEYRFDFNLEKYSFLAVAMSKICRNLDETRLKLVPDEVTEHEFWRNYFYQIELWKLQQGFENRLGAQIDIGEREQALAKEVERAEREIQILSQDELLQGEPSAIKVVDDADSSAVVDSSREAALPQGDTQESGIELTAV